jgi:hypothetical protein
MRHLAAGAIAGFGVAVIVAVVAISFLSVQEGTYAGADRSKYADHANSSILPSARNEQEACASAREPSEDAAEQRQKNDLCAQFRNAVAAERIARLTERQIGITSFEAFALVVSLIFTGWAAVAAARAARAAEQAVEQNEKTARLQLRAYVGLEHVQISGIDAPEGPTISLVIKNTGQTLATGVCFWGGYKFQKAGRYKLSFNRAFGTELSDWSPESVLMPNASETWHFTVPREEFDAKRVALLEEKVRLVFAGLILYFDIFGKDHDLEFAREMDVSAGLREGHMPQWGEQDVAS